MNENQLTPTEAMFGLMGWLTSREKELTLSAHHETPPAIEAITEFMAAQGITQECRENWTDYLKPMVGK